jgi:hypothetical protein
MTSGIIVILAALVPFVISLVQAKIAKDATPREKEQDDETQIDRVIASHNAGNATLLLNGLLARLPDPPSGNPK